LIQKFVARRTLTADSFDAPFYVEAHETSQNHFKTLIQQMIVCHLSEDSGLLRSASTPPLASVSLAISKAVMDKQAESTLRGTKTFSVINRPSVKQ
jgi:hypothetical protein